MILLGINMNQSQNSRNTNDTKPGFTLLEFLLYMSLFSLLLFGLTALFGIVLQSRAKYQSISEVEQSGAQAMRIITQYVRLSTGISAPLIGTTSTTLVLSMVSSTINPTVFDMSGGRLRMQQGSGSVMALTSAQQVLVSSLSFANYGQSGTTGSIRIQFDISKVNPSQRAEFQYQKTYYGTASVR